MSKNTEKKAAEQAEAKPVPITDGADFGLPDPADDKQVRAEIEAKRSEQRLEDEEVERNRRGHVKMHKNGAEIHVHPTTVADHESMGWRLSA